MVSRPHGWIREADLPNNEKVSDELLKVLSRFSRPVEPIEVYDLLADIFELSSVQRHATRETTEESAWHNRVQTARAHLVRQDYLDGRLHGLWLLTDIGRARAYRLENPPQSPEEIDL